MKDVDKEAVKLTLAAQVKEAILGVFGDEIADVSIDKIHSILKVASNLQLKPKDIIVKITFAELEKAKKTWDKSQVSIWDEPE